MVNYMSYIIDSIENICYITSEEYNFYKNTGGHSILDMQCVFIDDWQDATYYDIGDFADSLGLEDVDRIIPDKKYRQPLSNWLHELGHIVCEIPTKFFNELWIDEIFGKSRYFDKMHYVYNAIKLSFGSDLNDVVLNGETGFRESFIYELAFSMLVSEWGVGYWQHQVAVKKKWRNCLGVRNLWQKNINQLPYSYWIEKFFGDKTPKEQLTRVGINVQNNIYIPTFTDLIFDGRYLKLMENDNVMVQCDCLKLYDVDKNTTFEVIRR